MNVTLLSKKSIAKLGTRMNDSAGSKPSEFALKQMEKMGWKSGQGLGKNQTGIIKHLSVQKREDLAGLGSELVEAEQTQGSETWWHDTFAANLKAMKVKLSKKSKKRKATTNAMEDLTIDEPPSYAELFKATGGARLGMRARAEQKGKIKRTEAPIIKSVESISTDSNGSVVPTEIKCTVICEVKKDKKLKKRKSNKEEESI